MNEKTDYTAEIFAALGITPETHSECYTSRWSEYKDTKKPFIYTPISLLSGTLEADGLAAKVLQIAKAKQVNFGELLCFCAGSDWLWGILIIRKDQKAILKIIYHFLALSMIRWLKY